MRRNDAVVLTRNLLDQHSLPEWKVRLMVDVSGPLGQCVYAHKTIYLNAHHVDQHHEEIVKDTILHEIAHALCPNHGHDSVWREKAKEIGSHQLEACSHFGLNAEALDAIRSGHVVETTFEEEIIRRPKTIIHKLQDLCPECGKIAKEKFSFETVDKEGNEIKLITLECFHIIKKVIPRATPYHLWFTQGKGDRNCKHKWEIISGFPTCVTCGANKLFDFQVEGARAIEKGLALNKGFGLFDEMGLGKTVQGLAYIWHHQKEACPFLWVGKSGIKFQYFKEIITWCGVEFMPQVISTGKDFVFPGLKGYVIPYDLLRRFPREKLAKLGIKTVILDECQAVSNPDSARTQEVRDLVRDDSIRVIPCSGTFWKNRGSEAYVTLNMLDPRRFYSYEAFKRDWVDYFWEGNKRKEGGIVNPEKFKLLIADLAIRRERKEAMPNLASVSRTKLSCEVPEHARNALNKEMDRLTELYDAALIDGKEDSFATNAAVMQSLIIMRQIVGLAKVPSTVEFINEYFENGGDKITIFVHHKSVGAQILTHAQALANGMNGNAPLVLQLSAEKSGAERFEIQTKFNNTKRAILVASTLASGEGLNLQTCSDCIMHERQWNPANEEQAESRFVRLGQLADTVNATYVTADDSIDDELYKIVERKRRQFHVAMSNGQIPMWNEADVLKELVSNLVNNYKERIGK